MQSLETIFIIDDDTIQLKIATKMIERVIIPTPKIIPFAEAGTALSFLQQHSKETALLPDIILLDLNMPEMSGWSFLENFEKIESSLSKEIRIYILSSSQDDKDIERSKNHLSVNSYLVKPLTRDKILTLLKH
jgi:CheY-like chemotaxis protein